MTIADFIETWSQSSAAERANYQLFIVGLCDLLGVPHPNPSVGNNAQNEYVFERAVSVDRGDGKKTSKFLDCYKRGAFVLEAKQGSGSKTTTSEQGLFGAVAVRGSSQKTGTAKRGTAGWDKAMLQAKAQAEFYVKALPAAEGRPPFVLVVDVGYSIEVFSEFSRSGGVYIPFPDPKNHRIYLEDLQKEDVLERLRLIWTEPLSLDPTRRSAKATREIADKLARLAKSLEQDHAPLLKQEGQSNLVSDFLMRLIFTMFAEDMRLLPQGAFSAYLQGLRGHASNFKDFIEPVWQVMNTGGFSRDLKDTILQFNGGLFADSSALNLNEAQLDLVIQAAMQDWREVEPAIFGTLLERALDPRERHKLGAHYTPRAYVERLVNHTVLEPLRLRWEGVQTEFAADLELAADLRAHPEKTKGLKDQTTKVKAAEEAAIEKVKVFHQDLCNVRILDPACGSGNFLYVALEMLKRLEGEVLDVLERLGGNRRLEIDTNTVDPHQFLGLEVNPRAATIAELVLWIGYLQWHFRTSSETRPPVPVLRAFKNIQCRDAVLDYTGTKPVVDKSGQPVTRWDGVTTKTHPVTGLEVPDDTARVQELEYVGAKRATWPEADFVVGNPPFIGAGPMRATLGDGYAKALRAAHNDLSESSDFVMYWWNHAAKLVQAGKLERFGFVTTNSIKQTFNRRVLSAYLEAKPPLHLSFAIPDHPWVDAADGAAVRIAMTVAQKGASEGQLETVTSENVGEHGEFEIEHEVRNGVILPDLTIGANVTGTQSLKANLDLSCPGVKLHGAGFIVTPQEAKKLGLSRIAGLEKHIRLYRNGRDLTASPRDVMVIDMFGVSLEELRSKFPEVYQHLSVNVKPERDQNNREGYRANWWVFGEPRANFRPALTGLKRFIATVETAKHRVFVFLDQSILPDNMLVNIALEDAYFLGVLSSRIHVTWALAAGGTLEDRPRYNKGVCFEKFPFPESTKTQQSTIRALGEQIDTHRKRQQGLHPELTLTDTYNVLEKLRAGMALNDKDKSINDMGLVSTLLELHQRLDTAVLEAYGWPTDLTEDAILERLVALNAERVEEERNGLIRYLRPEYQNPKDIKQGAILDVPDEPALAPVKLEKTVFPKKVSEQYQAVRGVLKNAGKPLSSADIEAMFKSAKKGQVVDLLELMVGLGQVVAVDGDRYGV
jgi:hypothetical protein